MNSAVSRRSTAWWIAVVAARQRSLVNVGLAAALFVVGITIVGLFIDDGIDHLLAKMSTDHRQVGTLRSATPQRWRFSCSDFSWFCW